jgi:hypothetical protein
MGIAVGATTSDLAICGDEILFLFFTGQLPNTTEFGLFLETSSETLVLLQGDISFILDTSKSGISDSIARGPKQLTKNNSLLQCEIASTFTALSYLFSEG